MTLAQRMIDAAAEAGADIAKFQYWNPDKLKPGPWDTDGRREIYNSAKLSPSRISELRQLCSNREIEFLISVFNVEDAQLMKSLGINQIKVPSHEVANIELHRFCANNFEAVYASLGAGTTDEINAAAEVYNASKVRDHWVGMHCVSSYPVPAKQANLPRIQYLKHFVPRLGYSDHTTNTLAPALAVSLGAEVIEKHFTIDKTLPGRDNKNALDYQEFLMMVENIRLAERLMTDHGPEPLDLEQDTMNNYRGRWGD